jgi:hypothetical protein
MYNVWSVRTGFYIMSCLTNKQTYYCTDVTYIHLTCSISYGVNLYLDLWNKINSIQFSSIYHLIVSALPEFEQYLVIYMF